VGNDKTAEITDAVLVRIAAGETSAVDDCLSRFGGLVWSLAKRYCVASGEAEDAVQEIFIDLWQSAHRYDPAKSTETTFVALIARRRLIDRVRKQTTEPGRDQLDMVQLTSDQLDAEGLAEQVEDASQAKKCLHKLKGEEKNVIELTVCCGYSHAWVSEKLHLPLGTVKSHARRGLVKLRDCMKAAGFGLVPGGIR